MRIVLTFLKMDVAPLFGFILTFKLRIEIIYSLRIYSTKVVVARQSVLKWLADQIEQLPNNLSTSPIWVGSECLKWYKR